MIRPAARHAIAALASSAGDHGVPDPAHYADGSIVCPTDGCETVQRSSYALLGDVPVALRVSAPIWPSSRAVAPLGTTLGPQCSRRRLAALPFSTYLLAVQAIEIGAFCTWCLASDVVVTVIAALSAMAPGPGKLSRSAEWSIRPRKRVRGKRDRWPPTSSSSWTRTGARRTTSRSGRSSAREPPASRASAARARQAAPPPTLGTTPGLNLVYAHLKRAIRARSRRHLHRRPRARRPGHGRKRLPRGHVFEVYSHVSRDEDGLAPLFRQFSFPGASEPRGAGDAGIDP